MRGGSGFVGDTSASLPCRDRLLVLLDGALSFGRHLRSERRHANYTGSRRPPVAYEGRDGNVLCGSLMHSEWVRYGQTIGSLSHLLYHNEESACL